MTNLETEFTPEELDAVQAAADDFAYFGFIDEIADAMEDLTFDELEKVRDFVYHLQLERDES